MYQACGVQRSVAVSEAGRSGECSAWRLRAGCSARRWRRSVRSDRTSCSVRVLAGAFRMRCSAPVVSDRFSVPSCDCAAVSAGLVGSVTARGLLRRRRTGSDARCVRRRCRRRVRSARRVLIECCARCVSPLRSVPCSQWSVSGGFDDLDGRGQSVAVSRKVSFSGASRCSTRCPDRQSAPLGTARCPFVRAKWSCSCRRACSSTPLATDLAALAYGVEPFASVLPSCDSRRHAVVQRRGVGDPSPPAKIRMRSSALRRQRSSTVVAYPRVPAGSARGRGQSTQRSADYGFNCIKLD